MNNSATDLFSYFDSHCHFDFTDFDQRREQYWVDCRTLGIRQLMIPGTYPEQWIKSHEIAKRLNGIVMAAGFHPWWLDRISEMTTALRDQWLEYLLQTHCRAVGECGLDSTIKVDFEKQQLFFEEHLTLACELNKPLIIHVRKSHNETILLLKKYRPSAGGVIHGFSGSIELAQTYWRLGFYLGIGGTITYDRANKTREAVKQLPLEALLLETDAPDMPLSGFQGQINTPLQLVNVAKKLAELRREPLAEIAKTTTVNSQKLFQL